MKRMVNFVITVDIDATSEEKMWEAIARIPEELHLDLMSSSAKGSYHVMRIYAGLLREKTDVPNAPTKEER